MYLESIEKMGEDGSECRCRSHFKPSNYAPKTIYFVSGWDWEDHGLGEAKSAFGIVKLPDGLLDDPNCSK